MLVALEFKFGMGVEVADIVYEVSFCCGSVNVVSFVDSVDKVVFEDFEFSVEGCGEPVVTFIDGAVEL